MTETTKRLQIVTSSASGWCKPDTGVCHVDGAVAENDDERPIAESVDAAERTDTTPGVVQQ